MTRHEFIELMVRPNDLVMVTKHEARMMMPGVFLRAEHIDPVGSVAVVWFNGQEQYLSWDMLTEVQVRDPHAEWQQRLRKMLGMPAKFEVREGL